MTELRQALLRSHFGLSGFLAVWAFVMAIALTVRLATITQSFWWDECLTAIVCLEPWSDLVHMVGVTSSLRQLPLYYAIAHLFSDIYHTEWFIRLPSLLFSMATLPLLYRMVSRLTDQQTAFIAVFLLAISPMDVFCAHDARPYAMLSFGALFAFDGLLRAMERGKSVDWCQFVFGTALALHASYFGFLSLTSHGLCFLALLGTRAWQTPRAEWRTLLRPLASFTVSCLAALLLFAPLLPLMLNWLRGDFGGTPAEAAEASTSTAMSGFIFWFIAKFGWGTGLAWYGTSAFLLLGSLVLLVKNRLALIFCLAHFLASVLPFLLLLSHASKEHWQQRYILFLLPFFLLLLSVGLHTFARWCSESLVGRHNVEKRPLLWHFVLPCLLIVLLFARSIGGLFVENNNNFRDTSQFIMAHMATEDVIVSPRPFYAELVQSYLGNAAAAIDLADEKNAEKLAELCESNDRVWLISDRWQPQGAYGQVLRDLNFDLVSSGKAQGIELYLRDPARSKSLLEWRELARAEMRYHPYMDVGIAEALHLAGDTTRADDVMAAACQAMERHTWVECWDLIPNGSERVEQILLLINLQDRLGLTVEMRQSALEALTLDPTNSYTWYSVGKALSNK